MSSLILFNKPYGVLSQFSGDSHDQTLASYITTTNVYPAGRLDKDSEGLLLLTDSGALQHQISHPKRKMVKTYLVQVEGDINEEALINLRKGVILKDGLTRPARAKLVKEPALWPRIPPIRKRQNIPTSWIELEIAEGKNRQVRRMTAAVGFPTLRLVRQRIGRWALDALQPGESHLIQVD
ncbi:MAG: pseudouridine synthase [Gammaproteobacteria bacterium]|nr:pseudouridine synthase [Gammaproteobacteria bacterium]